MEPETLREIVAENRELEQKLTKRNEQYIFDLKKSLAAANLSEEEKTLALHEILPELVEGQKTGKTARQLFGTVSEHTKSILEKPEPLNQATTLQMWLDNTLMLLGVLSIMVSIMELLAKGRANPYGLLTLILSSMAGGFVFLIMYKTIYQYERPGADKSKRPGFLKSGLILVASVLIWLAVFAGASLLPATINPILDPMIVILIGAAALAFRFWYKKKYNISGSFFMR
ncbi:hypothetical protein RU97_GL002324 [Enterococcus canis]|jgi:Uncharacterized membrane-bound protein conserved in bacteria|uniref:Integral membrane protein n=1 Tax=Enterococcus canis TaxID=214095 RepID=A0A1L8REN5_9ENTE|nr:DUF1129 domain-containing protein [Enterococcus canis]OJG18251.1 hypothetical protein RU97_GL002324 [Enterococcus canis]